MPTEIELNKLIINKNLTKEQFKQALADGLISDNDLSFVDEDNEDSKISSCGRNVGDIFFTSRIDSELNGAVECNGRIYSTADFTGSQSIGSLLANGSLPYVSLEEYSSIVSTNGSCRAFGWDGGTSFRVPTLNDVYIEAGTATSAGEFINESLPNITGYSPMPGQSSSPSAYEGALKYTKGSGTWASSGSGGNFWGNLSFDASLSSSVYQDNAKVKPDSVRYRAMVQLATGATDEAVITATSALQQIGNKVDRSEADYVVESYVDGTEWYRVYKSGWVEQGGVSASTSTGVKTITLLKPFKDKNYHILGCYGDDGDLANGALAFYSKQTTTFNIRRWSGDSVYWRACGQGA